MDEGIGGRVVSESLRLRLEVTEICLKPSCLHCGSARERAGIGDFDDGEPADHDNVTPAFHPAGCGAGVESEVPRVGIEQFRFHVIAYPMDPIASSDEDPNVEFELSEDRSQRDHGFVYIRGLIGGKPADAGWVGVDAMPDLERGGIDGGCSVVAWRHPPSHPWGNPVVVGIVWIRQVGFQSSGYRIRGNGKGVDRECSQG